MDNPKHRKLTPEEVTLIKDFQDQADRFIDACNLLIEDRKDRGDVVREYKLAITHMEDALMRATRGVSA